MIDKIMPALFVVRKRRSRSNALIKECEEIPTEGKVFKALLESAEEIAEVLKELGLTPTDKPTIRLTPLAEVKTAFTRVKKTYPSRGKRPLRTRKG
jgi:hypothetical protein